MFKLLILGVVIYFVSKYMWRDSSLPYNRNQPPSFPKNKDYNNTIEDIDYTEKK